MTRPTAAPRHWPYRDHRTIAEIREDEARQEILDALGRDEKPRRRAA